MSLQHDHKSFTNREATNLISALNIKHNNDIDKRRNTLQSARDIYYNISEDIKNCFVINEYLRLSFEYGSPENILDIWHDIETFHQYKNEQQHLKYQLLMKCLLHCDPIDISKCITVLNWIQLYQYTLCIHRQLLLKLISCCQQQPNIDSLKYIEALIDEKVIDTQQDDVVIKTSMIDSYGKYRDMDGMWRIFESVQHDARDTARVWAELCKS